jgi:hypothetical protein
MAAPGTKEKRGFKWWKFARKHLAMDGMGQKALWWWHQLACLNPKLFRVSSNSDEASHWSRLETKSSPIDFAYLTECLSPRHRIILHNSCRRSPAKSFRIFLLLAKSYPSCRQRVVELCLYSPTIRISLWLICALCIKDATGNLTTKLLLVSESGVSIEVSLKLTSARGILLVLNLMCFFCCGIEGSRHFCASL